MGPRTVVVAGDGAGPAARLLAEAANWPLLAEPTSGARVGRQAIRTGRLLLTTHLRAAIERVVVVGHPTLSRPVIDLMSDPGVEVLAVRGPDGSATDPGRIAMVLDSVPTVDLPAEASWFGTWREADDRLSALIDEGLADGRGGMGGTRGANDALREETRGEDHAGPGAMDGTRDAHTRAGTEHTGQGASEVLPGGTRNPSTTPQPRSPSPLAVAAVVARAVVGHATLVVGSSNPVRDLDVMATPWPPHEHRFVVGNRGLAGIDGLVSTAVGVALGRTGASRTIAYLGDLTFVHDSNGLVIGAGEPRPDLTLVVLSDDGGALFSTLEQGDQRYAEAFERVFATPHGTDLRTLCAAHHTAYERVTNLGRLEAALSEQPSGVRVLEVPVSRSGRRREAVWLRELAREVDGDTVIQRLADSH